jgi:hypothetical protein
MYEFWERDRLSKNKQTKKEKRTVCVCVCVCGIWSADILRKGNDDEAEKAEGGGA